MAVLVAVLAVPAKADWLHKSEENPFTGDTHIAMGITDMSGYAVGFRCSKADDLSLVFVTPESVEDGAAVAGMNALGIKLLVIVDDQPKLTLEAGLDRAPGGSNKLRLVSSDAEIVGLIDKVKAAKKRVAMAVELMGQAMHAKSFDVRGSRRALDDLGSGCKIGAK